MALPGDWMDMVRAEAEARAAEAERAKTAEAQLAEALAQLRELKARPGESKDE